VPEAGVGHRIVLAGRLPTIFALSSFVTEAEIERFGNPCDVLNRKTRMSVIYTVLQIFSRIDSLSRRAKGDGGRGTKVDDRGFDPKPLVVQ